MKSFLILALAAVAICGRAAEQETKSTVQLFCPQPELLYKQGGSFPFAYFWRKDFIDIRKYEKIKIEPVADKFWLDENGKNNPHLQEALTQLSDMFVQEIRRAVGIEGRRIELTLTDKADEKTMILETALVPVMPLNNFRRYLSYRSDAGFSDADMLYGMLCWNLVAIEAVVKSGDNGEVIAQLSGLCGEAKNVTPNDSKAWPDAARKLLADWSLRFVSTIKAELNRAKDGRYLSISSKIIPPGNTKAKK